jgi:hypothetical protein
MTFWSFRVESMTKGVWFLVRFGGIAGMYEMGGLRLVICLEMELG